MCVCPASPYRYVPNRRYLSSSRHLPCPTKIVKNSAVAISFAFFLRIIRFEGSVTAMASLQPWGIYRSYKRDLDSVIAWLMSTARAFGLPAEVLNSMLLKPQNSTQASKYLVSLRSLLPLTTFVATHNRCVTVPESLIDTIDRIIALRAVFLTERLVPNSQSDIEKCPPFSSTLREVRSRLFPLTLTGLATPRSATRNAPTKHKSSSLPPDELYPAPIRGVFATAPERPSQQEGDSCTYELEPAASINDALLAYEMLVTDLDKIRTCIRKIWSTYKDGILDLAAAAVATDTAASLGRNLIEEVSPVLEQQQEGGVDLIINKFCEMQKWAPEVLEGKESSIPGVGGGTPTVDQHQRSSGCLYAAVYRVLIDLWAVPMKGLPYDSDCALCKYDTNGNRAGKTDEEKDKEDQETLHRFCSELLRELQFRSYPMEDEFLRCIRGWEQTRQISFSLVFAAQVFLDIHHTMGAATTHSWLTLHNEVASMLATYDLHCTFNNNTTANGKEEQDLADALRVLKQDANFDTKRGELIVSGAHVPSNMGPHSVLRFSPVLAGLYLFRARTMMRDFGIKVVNEWCSITYCAHLYNALEIQGLLEGRWADMDTELDLLGDAGLWVGGERPKTPGDCFRKFCEKEGLQGQLFDTEDRRTVSIAVLNDSPRGIRGGVPISAMFRDRFIPGAPDLGLTLENVLEIMGSAKGKTSQKMPMTTYPLVVRSRGYDQKGKARPTTAGSNRKASTMDIIPGKLAEALMQGVNSESLELAFRHLEMYWSCYSVLRMAKEACEPILKKLPPTKFLADRREKERLPKVIGHVLATSSGHYKILQDRGPLEAAAKVVNQFIATPSSSRSISIAERLCIKADFRDEVVGNDREEENSPEEEDSPKEGYDREEEHDQVDEVGRDEENDRKEQMVRDEENVRDDEAIRD